MSKEIREMIDKVKQFINEDLTNDSKYLYGEDLPKIMEFLKIFPISVCTQHMTFCLQS